MPPPRRVIDQTGTLGGVAQVLEARPAAFETKGTVIVVLMVPSTQPEDIAAHAQQRVADQWKIGRPAVGDGLLIVVAKNDRRVRIEVASRR